MERACWSYHYSLLQLLLHFHLSSCNSVEFAQAINKGLRGCWILHSEQKFQWLILTHIFSHYLHHGQMFLRVGRSGAGPGFWADVGQEALPSDALQGEGFFTQLLEQFLVPAKHPEGPELLGGSHPKRASSWAGEWCQSEWQGNDFIWHHWLGAATACPGCCSWRKSVLLESPKSLLMTTNTDLMGLEWTKSVPALPAGDTNYPNNPPHLSSPTDHPWRTVSCLLENVYFI